MAIDKQAFEDCFKQWLSYKPNKRKDWPALKGIYYQELSRFSEVQLREALGRMLTKNNYLDIEETGFEELQNAIDTHSHIFVTADSTSMITEIITRGYFVNVIEMRGPIKKEHHHEIIESFEKKGLLRILRLNQLQLSENKFQQNVKDFVVTERDALKSRILELL